MNVNNPEEPPEDELQRLQRLLREAQNKRDRYQRALDEAIERGDSVVRIDEMIIAIPVMQNIFIPRLNQEVTRIQSMIPQQGGTFVSPQEGDGFIQRNPRVNPPAVRKLLEKIGGETINTIKIVRTPLSFATRTLLNIASFGQLDKVMKQIGVDKFFHLSLLINGKWVYEKNAVINLTEDPNIVKKNSETLDVDVNRGLTIDEFVKNTQLQMADDYGPYDAKTNNCSIFVNAALKANWLSNPNTVDFLSQKTDKLFDGFPSLTKNIVDFATSLGSSVDRQVQGEGYRQGGLTPEDVKGLIYDSRNIIRTGDYIVGGGDMMYNYAYPRCKVKF